MNCGESMSGIQIWTGRSPILRSLTRWTRTFSAEDFGRRTNFLPARRAIVTCNLSHAGPRALHLLGAPDLHEHHAVPGHRGGVFLAAARYDGEIGVRPRESHRGHVGDSDVGEFHGDRHRL